MNDNVRDNIKEVTTIILRMTTSNDVGERIDLASDAFKRLLDIIPSDSQESDIDVPDFMKV